LITTVVDAVAVFVVFENWNWHGWLGKNHLLIFILAKKEEDVDMTGAMGK